MLHTGFPHSRGCGCTHPGCRRGFRAAHSSVTKPSRPGGDKLFQRVGSLEGTPGTRLRVEPTCKRWEESLVAKRCFCSLPQVYPRPLEPHQVQGGMGSVGQVGTSWPIWSFPNCFLYFKKHLPPPARKRPNEPQIQTLSPQG